MCGRVLCETDNYFHSIEMEASFVLDPPKINGGAYYQLPRRNQWTIAIIAVCILIFALWSNSLSLIPIGVLGLFGLWVILRNAFRSLLALIGIDVLISSRPQFLQASDSGLSPIDLLAGVVMVSILAYWTIRIRIVQDEPLSQTSAQLSLILFFLWSILVTAINSVLFENRPLVAVRELLNLSPLFIIPILYLEIVSKHPDHEIRIFGTLIGASMLILVENVVHVRQSILDAVYLYEMGRGNIDLSIGALSVIGGASYLMFETRKSRIRWGILFLLLQIGGLIMSFSRTHYVVVPLVTLGIIFWGTRRERIRGMQGILKTLTIALVGIAVVVIQSRLAQLMLKRYIVQFTSSSHIRTDRSLLSRFAEWKGEWQSILHSPIIGHGFGSEFRFLQNVPATFHTWVGFSHNSYLYLIFKTGFLGALLFLYCYVWFISKGFQLSLNKHLTERDRMITRTGIGFLLISLFEAYMGPAFDSKAAMISVGLVWGYFLALDYRMKLSTTLTESVLR